MTQEKSARINARISADAAKKVAYLQRATGKSTTDVIVASIDRYYAAVTSEVNGPAALLEEAGFIACVEGPADLSTTYKRDLARSLGTKA